MKKFAFCAMLLTLATFVGCKPPAAKPASTAPAVEPAAAPVDATAPAADPAAPAADPAAPAKPEGDAPAKPEGEPAPAAAAPEGK